MCLDIFIVMLSMLLGVIGDPTSTSRDSNIVAAKQTDEPKGSSLNPTKSDNQDESVNVYNWDPNEIMLKKYESDVVKTKPAKENDTLTNPKTAELDTVVNSKAIKSADIKNGTSLNSTQLKDKQVFDKNINANKKEKEEEKGLNVYDWKQNETSPRVESSSKTNSPNFKKTSKKKDRKKMEQLFSFSSFLYKPQQSYGSTPSPKIDTSNKQQTDTNSIIEINNPSLNVPVIKDNHITTNINGPKTVQDVKLRTDTGRDLDPLSKNNLDKSSNSTNVRDTLQNNLIDNKNEFQSTKGNDAIKDSEVPGTAINSILQGIEPAKDIKNENSKDWTSKKNSPKTEIANTTTPNLNKKPKKDRKKMEKLFSFSNFLYKPHQSYGTNAKSNSNNSYKSSIVEIKPSLNIPVNNGMPFNNEGQAKEITNDGNSLNGVKPMTAFDKKNIDHLSKDNLFSDVEELDLDKSPNTANIKDILQSNPIVVKNDLKAMEGNNAVMNPEVRELDGGLQDVKTAKDIKSKNISPKTESTSTITSISPLFKQKSKKKDWKKMQQAFSFSSFLYKPHQTYGTNLYETKPPTTPKPNDLTTEQFPNSKRVKEEFNIGSSLIFPSNNSTISEYKTPKPSESSYTEIKHTVLKSTINNANFKTSNLKEPKVKDQEPEFYKTKKPSRYTNSLNNLNKSTPPASTNTFLLDTKNRNPSRTSSQVGSVLKQNNKIENPSSFSKFLINKTQVKPTSNKGNKITNVKSNGGYDTSNYNSLNDVLASSTNLKQNFPDNPNSENRFKPDKLKNAIESNPLSHFDPVFNNQTKPKTDPFLEYNLDEERTGNYNSKYTQPISYDKQVNINQNQKEQLDLKTILAPLQKNTLANYKNYVTPGQTNKSPKEVVLDEIPGWNTYHVNEEIPRYNIPTNNGDNGKYRQAENRKMQPQNDWSLKRQQTFSPSKGPQYSNTGFQQQTKPSRYQNYIQSQITPSSQQNVFKENTAGTVSYTPNTEGGVYNGQFLHLNNVHMPLHEQQNLYANAPTTGHTNMNANFMPQHQNSANNFQPVYNNAMVNQLSINHHQALVQNGPSKIKQFNNVNGNNHNNPYSNGASNFQSWPSNQDQKPQKVQYPHNVFSASNSNQNRNVYNTGSKPNTFQLPNSFAPVIQGQHFAGPNINMVQNNQPPSYMNFQQHFPQNQQIGSNIPSYPVQSSYNLRPSSQNMQMPNSPYNSYSSQHPMAQMNVPQHNVKPLSYVKDQFQNVQQQSFTFNQPPNVQFPLAPSQQHVNFNTQNAVGNVQKPVQVKNNYNPSQFDQQGPNQNAIFSRIASENINGPFYPITNGGNNGQKKTPKHVNSYYYTVPESNPTDSDEFIIESSPDLQSTVASYADEDIQVIDRSLTRRCNRLTKAQTSASKEYTILQSKVSWYEAMAKCTNQGKTLATVNNNKEQQQLANTVRKLGVYSSLHTLEGVWSSGTDQSGQWTWVSTGNPVCYSLLGPNPLVSGSFCLEVFADTWSPLACSERRYVACESAKTARRKAKKKSRKKSYPKIKPSAKAYLAARRRERRRKYSYYDYDSSYRDNYYRDY